MVLAPVVVPGVVTVDHKVDGHCALGDVKGCLPPQLSVLTLLCVSQAVDVVVVVWWWCVVGIVMAGVALEMAQRARQEGKDGWWQEAAARREASATQVIPE